MLDSAFFILMATGLGVGMLHAFDADHVLAVASLSGKKKTFLSILKYSFKWGCGHGGILLLCGALFLLWDIQPNETLVRFAELTVGIILCVCGAYLLWSLRSKRIQLVEHQHGDVTHTHLVQTAQDSGAKKIIKHEHTPVLVGFIHGLAGSAPVIALLPSLMMGNSAVAFLYLMLFSVGCLVGMTAFGMVLAKGQSTLYKVSMKAVQWFRGVLGSVSLLFGVYWLVQFAA